MLNESQNPTPIHSVNIAYKKIAGFFIFAIIVLVAIILYFALSKAEIHLTVKNQPAKINFTAQVKENLSDNNYLETSILPGRILEITMEKTKEFSVKGKETSSDKYGGIITVINKKGGDQQLIKTTRFESSNGKIFRTQKNITVPANGSIDVYVMADGNGEEYNEGAGTFTIPGLNEASRKLVYGETKNPMKKESKLEYVMTQEDLDSAKKELTEELKTDGMQKLKELLVGDEKLDENAITAETLSTESSKNIGDDAENFNYTIKTKIVGVIFNKEDLLTLSQTLLKKQLSSSQQLTNYDNDSFKYSISNYVPEEKNATLEVELSANVTQNAQSESFNPDKLKGLTQQEIIDYFNTVPAIEKISVNFWPFWVDKAPKMSNHIHVILE